MGLHEHAEVKLQWRIYRENREPITRHSTPDASRVQLFESHSILSFSLGSRTPLISTTSVHHHLHVFNPPWLCYKVTSPKSCQEPILVFN
jgi:hypothetical protein